MTSLLPSGMQLDKEQMSSMGKTDTGCAACPGHPNN